MARIVCDAIPFCYGPAAALLNLGHVLKRRGFDLTAIGSGTTAELISGDPSFELITCDDSSKRIKLIRSLVQGADAYINVMDPETYFGVGDLAVPKVYIDFLFWMFSPLFAGSELQADLYVIENYPGAKERLNQYHDLVRSPVLVPPLIEVAAVAQQTDTRKLLISVGGLESRWTHVGSNTNYAFVIIPLVLKAARRIGGFDKILVTGGRRAMQQLAECYSDSQTSFAQLAHHDFLKELRTATVLVTHPGLYTPFEGFAHGIPTLLLPSSNYTQILQLRFYHAARIADAALDWEDLGIVPTAGPVPEGLPEEVGVQRVLDCIEIFEKLPEAQRILVKQLAQGLDGALREPESIVRLQNEFYRSLSWASGPELAAAAIANLLGYQ